LTYIKSWVIIERKINLILFYYYTSNKIITKTVQNYATSYTVQLKFKFKPLLINNLCYLVNILKLPITYVVEMFLKKHSNFWTTRHFFTLNSVSLNLITQKLLLKLLFAIRITTILKFYNWYDVKSLFT